MEVDAGDSWMASSGGGYPHDLGTQMEYTQFLAVGQEQVTNHYEPSTLVP